METHRGAVTLGGCERGGNRGGSPAAKPTLVDTLRIKSERIHGANADPDPNLSMGFDLAREVRPLHVTSPSLIHRF